MRIGPFVILRTEVYSTCQELALKCIREHGGPTIDFGGVKIARELVPHILHAADGALVLTRHGEKLRISRPRVEEFVVTVIRE